MQITGTAYANLLRQPNKAPIYIAEFDGIPTRYSTGPVTNPLGATEQLMRVPMGSGQQITPDEGRSSISAINFSILDKNGTITNLVFLYQMGNRQVTIKMGFVGLDESKYTTVYLGRILTFGLEADNTFYKFQVTDLQRQTKGNIFTASTKLTAGVGPGDVTINVGNTADFAPATAGQFYFRVDNEVIGYTGVTATSFTGCMRGQLGTTAGAHNIDGLVQNIVVLEDNPLTLALQILTSTGLGTNGAYDVLPASCGLAIPENQVNVARFELERDRWTSSITFRFEEQFSTVGKRFIEEQLYTFIPAYPVVDNFGRLSVKVAGPPLPTDNASQFAFDESNIMARPSTVGNVLDHYFFNELDLFFDFNFLTNAFASRNLYEDATSQGLFGEVRTRTMESRGIRSSLMTTQRINNFGTRFLKRYAKPTPIIEAVGLLSTRLVEVGDILPLTNSKMPNFSTGKIGIVSQLMEVIEASPDYAAGTVKFQLLNTNFSYGRRYAAISPSAKAPILFPNYLVATSAQRNYAFISEKVTATRGIMSNGDEGYSITP